MKVVIVGGVAGGASCAARLRRLDEKAEILMVERGPYVSYANCGLPYHISGVIPKESSLLVANEQFFKGFFQIDVRTSCEAVSIDRKKKTVDLKNVATGEVTTESYDKLVLSPGAASIRPPLPGIDLPGIFQVRTVPDARAIREWIEKGTAFLAGMFNYSGIQFVKPPRRAVVIGGGFIGLETAENLVHAGFEVTLVEMLDQVLAPLDREFARLVEEHLKTPRRPARARRRRRRVHAARGRRDRGEDEVRKDVPGRGRDPRPRRPSRHDAGEGRRPRDRRARRDPRRRPHAHERPGHLRRRRRRRGEGLGDRAVEPRGAGRAGEPPGADRGRRHRGARLPLPRHPGDLDHRALRRRRRLDRRQREDAEAQRRHRLREDLPLPERARRLLPGREDARAEGPLPQVRRPPPRGAVPRRGRAGGGQADQRPRDGPPDEARRCRTSRRPSSATRPSSGARRTRSTSPGWSRATSSTATCRSPTGARRTARSSSTCASRSSSSSRPSRAPSTSRSRSSARASASCRRTGRSSPSAAPRGAPTTRRGSSLQNGFKARVLSGGMLSRAMVLER